MLTATTLVRLSPALVGSAVARRRGEPRRWQLRLAASLAAVGALAVWRLGPVELCVS